VRGKQAFEGKKCRKKGQFAHKKEKVGEKGKIPEKIKKTAKIFQ